MTQQADRILRALWEAKRNPQPAREVPDQTQSFLRWMWTGQVTR